MDYISETRTPVCFNTMWGKKIKLLTYTIDIQEIKPSKATQSYHKYVFFLLNCSRLNSVYFSQFQFSPTLSSILWVDCCITTAVLQNCHFQLKELGLQKTYYRHAAIYNHTECHIQHYHFADSYLRSIGNNKTLIPCFKTCKLFANRKL